MALDASRPGSGCSMRAHSRFQEGSMNDRVSTVPPAQFLGPEEIRSYESQFYTSGERERPLSADSESQTQSHSSSLPEDENPYPDTYPYQQQYEQEHEAPHNHPYPCEAQQGMHPTLAAKKSGGLFGRVRDAFGLRSRGGSVASSFSASLSVTDSRPQSQATSLMSQGLDHGQGQGQYQDSHVRRKHISMPEPPPAGTSMITKTKTATARGRQHQYPMHHHRAGPRSQSQTNVPLMHHLSHQPSGATLDAPLHHHPSFASMAAATSMRAAPPFPSSAGDRPSREEILQSYHQLMASGFFKAHAIQSTRQPPPGTRTRPSSRHGQQNEGGSGGHTPLPTIPSVGSGLEKELPSPTQQEFRLHELSAASKLKYVSAHIAALTKTPEGEQTPKPQPQLRRRHPMMPGRKRSRADLDDGFSRSSTESMSDANANGPAPTSAAAAPHVSVTPAPEEQNSTTTRAPSPLKRVAKKIRKMPSSIAAATASTSSLFGSASTGPEEGGDASRPTSPVDGHVRMFPAAAQSTSSLAAGSSLHPCTTSESRGVRVREPSPAPSFAPSFAQSVHSVGSDRTISMAPPATNVASSMGRMRSKMSAPPSAGLNRAASRFGGAVADIRREPSGDNIRRPFNNKVVNGPPGAQNNNSNEGGDTSRQSSNSSITSGSGISIRHVGPLVGVETTPRGSADMDMDMTPRASVDTFEGYSHGRGRAPRSNPAAAKSPPSAGMNGLNRAAGILGGRIRRQLSGSSIGRSISKSHAGDNDDGEDRDYGRDTDRQRDHRRREDEESQKPATETPRGRRTMKSPPSAGLNKASGAMGGSGGGVFGNIKRSLSGSRIGGRFGRRVGGGGDEENATKAAAADKKEDFRRSPSKLLRRPKSPTQTQPQPQVQAHSYQQHHSRGAHSDATAWVSEFGFVGGGRGVALSGSRGDRQQQNRFSAAAAAMSSSNPVPKRESSLRGSWTKRSLKSRSEPNASSLAVSVSRPRTPSPSRQWPVSPTTPSPTKGHPLGVLPDTASNRGTPTPTPATTIQDKCHYNPRHHPMHQSRSRSNSPQKPHRSPPQPLSQQQQQRGFEIAAALGVPPDNVVFDENRMVIDFPYGQAL